MMQRAEVSDEVIMGHVRDGSLSEISILFERYHLRIYNFFFRLTYDMDVSQDLTQNLFYRMIKYRTSYNSDFTVKSWMFQIARNLHANFCNQEKRRGEIIQRTERDPAEIPEEDHTYNEEDYLQLDRALGNLSPEQKELLVLSRYQGLKYEEISEITNQSVAAIKVAIHRAIRQLRRIYFNQV
jgi:RNA polymerase sigma factor (sigma-70 family)